LGGYIINHFRYGINSSTSKKTSKQRETAALMISLAYLPKKGWMEKAIFDYEKILYDAL
jgi:hypothetical protein